MNDEPCEGCVIFEKTARVDRKCGLIRERLRCECPCANCIVKITCNIACKEFLEFEKSQKFSGYWTIINEG